MEKRIEVKIVVEIMEKLGKMFPLLFDEASEEFLDFYGKESLINQHIGQFFYRWFFSEFTILDGKDMVSLAGQCLMLNEKEEKILKNIREGILGYFKILKIKGKDFYLKDVLTKKEYLVKTIELEHDFRGDDVVEAHLVRNLAGEYFFFGGIQDGGSSRVIELNLLEYSRDLDIDELVERESLIISGMNQESMINYLEEVLDFDDEEAIEFISSSKEKREGIVRDKIINMDLYESEDEDYE